MGSFLQTDLESPLNKGLGAIIVQEHTLLFKCRYGYALRQE